MFVTVRDDGVLIRKALSKGARGYVVKADAGDELSNAVRTVLAGGRYVSASARAALEGSGLECRTLALGAGYGSQSPR